MGRDAAFDSGRLKFVMDALHLDVEELAKLVGCTAKTIRKNWLDEQQGGRARLSRIRMAIDILNEKASQLKRQELHLPPDFLRSDPPAFSTAHTEADDDEDAELMIAFRLLYDARNSTSSEAAGSAYRELVTLTTRPGEDYAVVRCRAHRGLAQRSRTRQERQAHYQAGLDAVSQGGSVDILVEAAELVLDLCVDEFAGFSTGAKLKHIAAVRRRILALTNGADRGALDSGDFAMLLTRISALNRHNAKLASSQPMEVEKWLGSAHRTATLACHEDPKSTGPQLEKTLVEWFQCQQTRGEFEYADRLRKVASAFAQLNQTAPTAFSLLSEAQLHRHNFAGVPACRAFERLVTLNGQSEMVLAQASLYAEAALTIENECSPAEVSRHRSLAEVLLRQADAAGVGTARHFGSLIRLVGRNQDNAAACRLLYERVRQVVAVADQDIGDAVMRAVEESLTNPMLEAFAIGISSCECLCALGTAVGSGTGDWETARRLFERAQKANENSPTPYTNLARYFLRSKPPGWEDKAWVQLDQARNRGKMRFRWWRALLYEWQRETAKHEPKGSPQPTVSDVLMCADGDQLHRTLNGGRHLETAPPDVLIAVVRKLAELRYAVRMAATTESLVMRIYDRQFAHKLTSDESTQSQLIFDVEKLPETKRGGNWSSNPIAVVLSLDDLRDLLDEKRTLDRVLYGKSYQQVQV